jgi:hypothetical protein
MDEINPIPYLITFAILFLILLGVFTWALSIWYKEFQCGSNPNIWCNDDWTCARTCTSEPVNDCFKNNNQPGLASCLYGPNSAAATACYTVPDSNDPNIPACTCPTTMENTSNCFSGCPSGLGSVNAPGGAVCCCTTTDPWCLPKDLCTSAS